MGYTTVVEAAVPVLSAKHTHEELRDTPIVDKACNLLMANNEIVLDLLEVGDFERAKHVVAWLIWAAKAYGVRRSTPAASPPGSGAKTPRLCRSRSTATTRYARKIVAALAQIIDELGLPHPCIFTVITWARRETSPLRWKR